jgi:hypothetical protein
MNSFIFSPPVLISDDMMTRRAFKRVDTLLARRPAERTRGALSPRRNYRNPTEFHAFWLDLLVFLELGGFPFSHAGRETGSLPEKLVAHLDPACCDLYLLPFLRRTTADSRKALYQRVSVRGKAGIRVRRLILQQERG